MRNAIYHLVADDIDEVSIIGRKLNSNKATSEDHVWLWDTMAKHPLSQTCRQLRQEFDPVHQRRALTTGVARYRLELEDFDVHRIETFAKLIGLMPKVIQTHLRDNVAEFRPIIRYNLTPSVFSSIFKLERGWRDLSSPFTQLQRALNIDNYSIYASQEVNLNFKTQGMSPAQKKLAPTHNLMANAKRKLKKMSDEIHSHQWTGIDEIQRSATLFEKLCNQLNKAHYEYSRLLREAREDRAKKTLKEQLEVEMRVRLRDELKAELRDELKEELRAEIMNELNAEVEGEML
jgi:hypothetical protein